MRVVLGANKAGDPVELHGDGMAKSTTSSGGSAASAARPGPRMGPGGGGAGPASSNGSDSDVLPSSAPPSVAGGPSASVPSRPARWGGPGRDGAGPSLGMGWSRAVETGGRPVIHKSVRSESGSRLRMGTAQKITPTVSVTGDKSTTLGSLWRAVTVVSSKADVSEQSRGAGLATGSVPGTAETTQESVADVDVAPGVVTHIN